MWISLRICLWLSLWLILALYSLRLFNRWYILASFNHDRCSFSFLSYISILNLSNLSLLNSIIHHIDSLRCYISYLKVFLLYCLISSFHILGYSQLSCFKSGWAERVHFQFIRFCTGRPVHKQITMLKGPFACEFTRDYIFQLGLKLWCGVPQNESISVVGVVELSLLS